MANRPERKLGTTGMVLARTCASPLDRLLPAADDARELTGIARRGIRFIEECLAPNLHEHFSIANRRDELKAAVKARKARIAAAARRAA